ncbi:unnamed protein product [Rhodiola kirilowii]
MDEKVLKMNTGVYALIILYIHPHRITCSCFFTLKLGHDAAAVLPSFLLAPEHSPIQSRSSTSSLIRRNRIIG